MKKRVLAALLAAVMVMGLAGCGDQSAKESQTPAQESSQEAQATSTPEPTPEPKDPVTIAYWYRNNVGEQQYTKDVEGILNGMLKEMEGYEHISIELHPFKNGDAFTLAQADGSKIDLVAHYGTDFVTLVANGDFIPLDDLIAQYPNVVSELPEWMVDFGKVNGEMYYIPAYQQACARNFVIFPNKYLSMYYSSTGKTEADVREALGKRAADVDATLDFYEEYLMAVRQETGLETKWLGCIAGFDNWYTGGQIVSYSTSLFEIDGEEPVYWQATDTYYQVMKRMNEWYKAGYIHPDFATMDMKPLSGDNMLSDQALVCYTGYRTTTTEELVVDAATPNLKSTAFWVDEHDYIISKYAAGGNAIYADCEHPEEAMMIIELLMTEKGEEFYNTFVWGIEGTHWEWVDEANDRIKTLEYDGSQGGSTSTYHAWKWNVGNTFNAWKNQAVTDGYNEMIEGFHNSPETVSSELIGVTWDLSDVADKISQCTAVDKEYDYKTLTMAKDFEATYAEYIAKLKAAGVEDVQAAVVKIYNDYTASK